jgi:hypothetical protein
MITAHVATVYVKVDEETKEPRTLHILGPNDLAEVVDLSPPGADLGVLRPFYDRSIAAL